MRWPTLHTLAGEPSMVGADCSDWTELSLQRIAELDPRIGAFLHVVGDGPDRDFGSGRLAGVPVAVKDNIAVQNMPLTCGSCILAGYVSAYNATVVSRMIAEGAFVVGKTNLDEFGMGSSTEFSAIKPCYNPWDPNCVPGGSSGGSAAAVAAGLVPVALGSDTGGSSRQPAAFCGIVGFKPSYGAVSRFGLVAYGSSLDQVGIMGTRVGDVATVFDVIHGPDDRDQTVLDVFPPARKPSNVPRRIGIVSEWIDHPSLETEQKDAVLRTAEACRDLGMSIDLISVPDLNEAVIPAYYVSACAEAGSNLARFDGVRYGPRGAIRDQGPVGLLRSTRDQLGDEVKLRLILGAFVLSSGHYDQFYGKAQVLRSQLAHEFSRVFSQYDALLTPVVPTRAFRHGEFGDDPLQMKLADLYTVTANLIGVPALSLPVSVEGGLPTAVQLMAERGTDRDLLALADELETGLQFDPEQCPLASRGPLAGL